MDARAITVANAQHLAGMLDGATCLMHVRIDTIPRAPSALCCDDARNGAVTVLDYLDAGLEQVFEIVEVGHNQ